MSPIRWYLLGVGSFLVGSYVLHCRFNLGPWPCQRCTRELIA